MENDKNTLTDLFSSRRQLKLIMIQQKTGLSDLRILGQALDRFFQSFRKRNPDVDDAYVNEHVEFSLTGKFPLLQPNSISGRENLATLKEDKQWLLKQT